MFAKLSCVFFTYLLFCLVYQFGYSQPYAISGYVKDAGNGEELIGVTVLVVGTGSGTVSNCV